ncbi:antimicrobial peptide, SdpC family [Paenibacillus tianmuensis]|uniref:Antimicrobial peptide, SdpC family n=1 Tax=Paenibacillus tianmuensis TaxID=624147 RepID=A0A1G4TZY8_9BACL|nr:sporulation delaying protein family toxin [Paenibacillus tianmuensis]SCW86910.1 antimicrobial peptide, SdpC family [Paenibacillus tianmuensis]
MKRMLALFLAVILIMTSSSVFAAGTGSKQKYSGEQIFRGLVFGQGEVARLFPSIWPEEMLVKLSNPQAFAVTEQLVQQIKELDPTYFDLLEKAAYSGNHLQVRNALAQGGELVEKTVKNLQLNPDIGRGTGLCAVAAVGYLVYLGAVFTTGAAVTHVALVNAAAGVTVYLAVVAGKYLWTSSASAHDASLKQDMIVNNVVKAFSR